MQICAGRGVWDTTERGDALGTGSGAAGSVARGGTGTVRRV
jgi:hypothetical protein